MQISNRRLCFPARIILWIGAILLLVWMIAVSYIWFRGSGEDVRWMSRNAGTVLETMLAGGALTVAGSLLAEYVVRRGERES